MPSKLAWQWPSRDGGRRSQIPTTREDNPPPHDGLCRHRKFLHHRLPMLYQRRHRSAISRHTPMRMVGRKPTSPSCPYSPHPHAPVEKRFFNHISTAKSGVHHYFIEMRLSHFPCHPCAQHKKKAGLPSGNPTLFVLVIVFVFVIVKP